MLVLPHGVEHLRGRRLVDLNPRDGGPASVEYGVLHLLYVDPRGAQGPENVGQNADAISNAWADLLSRNRMTISPNTRSSSASAGNRRRKRRV